jgi:hypothetical protein
MTVNRYQGLAVAIALAAFGKALVALFRVLFGAGE